MKRVGVASINLVIKYLQWVRENGCLWDSQSDLWASWQMESKEKKSQRRKNVYICLSVSRNKWWVQAKLLLTLATFCSLRKTKKQTNKANKIISQFYEIFNLMTFIFNSLSLYSLSLWERVHHLPVFWDKWWAYFMRERERRLTRERRVFSVYSMYIIPVTNLHVFFFLSAPNLFLVL